MCSRLPPVSNWSNHRIVAYSGVGYCDHDLDDLPLLRFGSRGWDSKGGSLARLGRFCPCINPSGRGQIGLKKSSFPSSPVTCFAGLTHWTGSQFLPSLGLFT